MPSKIILVLTAIFATLFPTVAHPTDAVRLPCMKKIYGLDAIVCVCNLTYCDTVEPETILTSSQYSVYQSTKNGDRLEKSVGNFSSQKQPSALLFRLNENVTFQNILGFGGTFTDAAGMNIADLPDGGKDNLISSYFGPDGIEYTLGRIPIASNDFSTDVYSYDFTIGDTYLSKFTISGYDHLYKIPFIDQAVQISRRNVTLFATPWSPPGWMKASGNMDGYGTILPSMAKVYANYLARFLREYESFMFHGRLWGMTLQNQPSNGCIQGFPYQALCWTPREMHDWLESDLMASLKESGYGYIKVMVADEPIEFLPYWTEAFSSNSSKASEYVSGFAVHSDPSDVDFDTLPLDSVHELFPDKFILSTEAFIDDVDVDNHVVSLGNWSRAEFYAQSIMADLNHWVTGWTDWNLALDVNGGPSWINNAADSPIIVDKENGLFYKQPMFYAIGHFSKFIPPGSIRVSMEMVGADPEMPIPSVAFLRPDGSLTAVVPNFSDEPVTISIEFRGQFINHVMQQRSIQSFTWTK